MTTKKAVEHGRAMQDAKQKLQNKSMTKKAFDDLQKEMAFKDVSVFHEFFGADWDIISRIACDPAHELQNLVKDMLALVHTQLVVITANLLFTTPNCMLQRPIGFLYYTQSSLSHTHTHVLPHVILHATGL